MSATEDLLAEITRRAAGTARVLVAVAGPPGSGKSTFAEHLADRLGPTAAVLPMDGFHLDNTTLRELGLFERKGAPETFDAEGFIALVKALRREADLSYPTFDRGADATVPDGGRIDQTSKIILIEGNYLLLDRPPWSDIDNLVDLSVFLEVPRAQLLSRLIRRWRAHGLSEADAAARAMGNDMRNVDVVNDTLRTPDFIIHQN